MRRGYRFPSDEGGHHSVFISWAGRLVRFAGEVESVRGIGVRQLRVALRYLEAFSVDRLVERSSSWVTAQFLCVGEVHRGLPASARWADVRTEDEHPSSWTAGRAAVSFCLKLWVTDKRLVVI